MAVAAADARRDGGGRSANVPFCFRFAGGWNFAAGTVRFRETRGRFFGGCFNPNGQGLLAFVRGHQFIQHQHSVRRQIVIAGKGLAREEIVHRLVKVQPHM